MSEMNKYVKMFMDDHDLKVGDEFRAKGVDVAIWHFNQDGTMENQAGFRNNKVLTKLLLGEYAVEKLTKTDSWEPKLCEKYWIVTQGGDVTWYYNESDSEDKYIFAHSLVFPTEEEAEDYKRFLDKVDEYKKTFEPEKDNCYFYYDHNSDRIFTTCDQVYPNQGTIYFGDEDNINEFFEEVGEERIKKYWFSIWR